MKFRHELKYDAPPDQVYAMLADPAFREASCAAQDVVSAKVDVVPEEAAAFLYLGEGVEEIR